MTTIPPAIIFINNDINDVLQSKLSEQLRIHEVLSKQEFDDRVLADPNYPSLMTLLARRILVLCDSLQDQTNRDYADVVIFVKAGLASIEKNKFGPPGQTYPIEKINIYDTLRAVNSANVIIITDVTQPTPSPLGGIFTLQGQDSSGVHDANPDNIYNNTDFINRK